MAKDHVIRMECERVFYTAQVSDSINSDWLQEFFTNQGFVHPEKLSWNQKRDHVKRKIVLLTQQFSGASFVSFQGMFFKLCQIMEVTLYCKNL